MRDETVFSIHQPVNYASVAQLRPLVINTPPLAESLLQML